jgi:Kef-type K+ transport system membrane component KefB
MNPLNAEEILIGLCCLVILSYIFSIISGYIRIPSVLLLLFAGVAFRMISDNNGWLVNIPARLIEMLGVVGLIMIVLEAGLDLKLGRDKLKLIRDSFFTAFFIFVISTALVTMILYYWLNEPIMNCVVYAIPLSIISSSIVIPSIHALTARKKEFLVYEASFSDILGIIVFNFLTSTESIDGASIGLFTGRLILSFLFSLVLSLILLQILAKTKLNIKFFLVFSLLILIYAGGKLLHLPSLLIILIFGLMINNWEKVRLTVLQNQFPSNQVEPLRNLLHNITAESSFLVRTFFFLIFGFSISLSFLKQNEVLLIGTLILFALFVVRALYLRFFMKTNLFPEMFFIPRGLITIVLFYKIPPSMKLHNFNDGILFFIILATSIVMALGMIFYKKRPEEIVEEAQFAERSEL